MRVHPEIILTDEERADLRSRVLQFIEDYGRQVIVISKGLDGAPNYRLMGVLAREFTLYTMSIKPSAKLLEWERDPRVDVLWYRNNATDPGQDQPLRLVALTGTVQLVTDAAGIRTMPTLLPFPGNIDDAWLEEFRVGVVIQPKRIRVEGFLPGPRYPVFLEP